MKVFLKCVYKNNLGDDLFIKTICERYPNTTFVTLAKENVKLTPKIPNLKVYSSKKIYYRLVRKISFILNKTCAIDRLLIRRCDLVVTIGGSLFWESSKYKNKKVSDKYYNTFWYEGCNKPLYILGANIGPIYNDYYIKKVENIFRKAKDVCLRDRKSLSYVDASLARVAPDIVFGSNIERKNKDSRKHAIISVIDCKQKSSQLRHFDADRYNKAILDIIDGLQKASYDITLFSFCKSEGDEEAISQIIANANNQNIDIYCYDGNINEALDIFSKADYIFGSRFHANVLGFALGKKVIPISYNDKTVNLLKDLGFYGKYIDIEKDIYPSIKELLSNKPLPQKQVENLRTNSLRHFDVLDKVLN